ncbi:MAG: hypothetical protein ACFBSG_11400 [Leptolyngbyaceae cyanobacterium]
MVERVSLESLNADDAGVTEVSGEQTAAFPEVEGLVTASEQHD